MYPNTNFFEYGVGLIAPQTPHKLNVGCWLLVVGYWLLVVSGARSLAPYGGAGSHQLLVVGCWLLVVGCWSMVSRDKLRQQPQCQECSKTFVSGNRSQASS